ncbi:MAG TPA: hypothetical protein VIA62_17785 [Thermoanaerobaculia bacterium]|jgi:hypothetical protein|nr:hypothetical protein [Thermoanaerobaculia bacterium]
MKTRNVVRILFAPLLIAAALLGAGPAFAQAQERAVPVEAEAVALARPAVCPAPFNVTLNANTPYVLPSDVPHGVNYQTSLNYTGADKAYLHTFVWKHEQRCCQVTSAILTVHMKANLPGQSNSDASNDDISIVHAGQVVQPYNERVYNGTGIPHPFPAGQTATKTWTLNPTALGILNSTGMLTFYVEDDTSVTSATLQLSGCCLTN